MLIIAMLLAQCSMLACCVAQELPNSRAIDIAFILNTCIVFILIFYLLVEAP